MVVMKHLLLVHKVLPRSLRFRLIGVSSTRRLVACFMRTICVSNIGYECLLCLLLSQATLQIVAPSWAIPCRLQLLRA